MKRQFFRGILSGSFRMLESLNIGEVRELQFRKYIIYKDFF